MSSLESVKALICFTTHLDKCNLNQQAGWDEAQSALNECPPDEGTSIATAAIADRRQLCSCGLQARLERAPAFFDAVQELIRELGIVAEHHRRGQLACIGMDLDHMEVLANSLIESGPCEPEHVTAPFCTRTDPDHVRRFHR